MNKNEINSLLEKLHKIEIPVGGCAVLLQKSDGGKYFFVERVDDVLYMINSTYFYFYDDEYDFEKMELLFKSRTHINPGEYDVKNPGICKDVIKTYQFLFGMYRYRVEHFDHNKHDNVKHDDTDTLTCTDYWDTLYGTKVYRFRDSDWEPCVNTAIFLGEYLEQDELESAILADTIKWNVEDPYDFRHHIITDRKAIEFRSIINKRKTRIEHGYPECVYPYDKCPLCGGLLEECDTEPENVVDVFNSRCGSSEDGGWSVWEEVHRCPHCGKLFYIEGES